jgi:hypothetical protein
MLANLGDRMATQHSLLLLERVKNFVDTCQRQGSDMQVLLNELRALKPILALGNEEDPEIKKELDYIKKVDNLFDNHMKHEFDKLTRGMIRFNYGDLFTLLMTNICKNLQAFDATTDRQQRRGQAKPARNRKVDHLYAMICGKYQARMEASLRKQGDSAVTSVDGSNALTSWLINYIFQFLGNTDNTRFDEKRGMLFIDGEELSVRYDMNPPVRGTYLDCAAMSGAMSIPGHVVAFTQVNNRILVHDSNESHPIRLTKLAQSHNAAAEDYETGELVKPLVDLPTDDAQGDAKFMKDTWALRLDCIKDDGVIAPCDNMHAFALYFTRVTTGGGMVPTSHRPAMSMPRARMVQAHSVHSSSPSLEGVAGYSHRRTPRHDSSDTRYTGAEFMRNVNVADDRYITENNEDASWDANKSFLLLMMMTLYVATEEVDYVEGVDDGLVSYMEDTESDDDLRSIDHGGYEHQFGGASLTRPVCGAVLAAVTVVLACLPR